MLLCWLCWKCCCVGNVVVLSSYNFVRSADRARRICDSVCTAKVRLDSWRIWVALLVWSYAYCDLGCFMRVRHYSSNATCLVRPRLFYALCVVSRSTIICHIICHLLLKNTCITQVASDKVVPLKRRPRPPGFRRLRVYLFGLVINCPVELVCVCVFVLLFRLGFTL